MTVETDDDIISDNNCDLGPPTDNPSENIKHDSEKTNLTTNWNFLKTEPR